MWEDTWGQKERQADLCTPAPTRRTYASPQTSEHGRELGCRLLVS